MFISQLPVLLTARKPELPDFAVNLHLRDLLPCDPWP